MYINDVDKKELLWPKCSELFELASDVVFNVVKPSNITQSIRLMHVALSFPLFIFVNSRDSVGLNMFMRWLPGNDTTSKTQQIKGEKKSI